MAMVMSSAHEVSPVLQELNHGGPRLAIGLEAILSRDDRERATESAFHLARDRRNALALQAACVPSSAETRLEERSVPRWQHQRVARGRDFQHNEYRTLGRMQHRHRGVELAYLPH